MNSPATASIALIGDHSPAVPAHRAIPLALERAAADTQTAIEWRWVATDTIDDAARDLADCDAIWAAPASPYRSMAGALAAIRFARETGRPLLGTCGGFQHALIEFARDVARIDAADHAETNPAGAELIVTPLACSLVETSGEIVFAPESQLHAIFGGRPVREEFHCRYGLNPAWRERLERAGLRFTGFDANGEVRACELPGHPFFVGTLFQPERSALRDASHPLIAAFVAAVARRALASRSA